MFNCCSILMECRDIANNSIFARRFVLYDNVSTVQHVSTGNRGLHVSSAVEITGYKWQPDTGRKHYLFCYLANRFGGKCEFI